MRALEIFNLVHVREKVNFSDFVKFVELLGLLLNLLVVQRESCHNRLELIDLIEEVDHIEILLHSFLVQHRARLRWTAFHLLIDF